MWCLKLQCMLSLSVSNSSSQEVNMDPSTIRLAQTIYRERLKEAELARQWAKGSVTTHLRDRLRLALSARLIRWGERLQVPSPRMVARS